jgi:hypothetical protein
MTFYSGPGIQQGAGESDAATKLITREAEIHETRAGEGREIIRLWHAIARFWHAITRLSVGAS